MVRIKGLIEASVTVIIIFAVLSHWGDFFWMFDLLSHFQIQYIVYLFMAAAVLFFLNSRHWALVAVSVVVLLMIHTFHYWFPYAGRPQQGEFSLMTYNLRTGNERYSEVVQYIRDSGADLALVLEVDSQWEQHLQSLYDIYPYHMVHSREDNFGLMLLSRQAISTGEVRYLSDSRLPSITAVVEMSDARRLHIVGTHPIPPYSQFHSQQRNRQLQAISQYVGSLPYKYQVVAGDLNVTPFSPVFDAFIKDAHLKDSGKGQGWQPTWLSQMPWFAIPIDYVLFSESVSVKGRWVGPAMGSDHNPLIVNFDLN